MEIYKNCIYGYPKSVDTGNKISTFVEQFYTLAPGEKRKYAHTLVTDTDVVYHGHQIVHRNLNDSIWIRTKGWFSTATKRRLNAILKRHGLFYLKGMVIGILVTESTLYLTLSLLQRTEG